VILDALLSEQHLTCAAERLHLSQPAVSHALAHLRDLLGNPLLVRAGAGLVPSARPLELIAPFAETVAQVQSLLAPNTFVLVWHKQRGGDQALNWLNEQIGEGILRGYSDTTD
jgi:hypothetical protein